MLIIRYVIHIYSHYNTVVVIISTNYWFWLNKSIYKHRNYLIIILFLTTLARVRLPMISLPFFSVSTRRTSIRTEA